MIVNIDPRYSQILSSVQLLFIIIQLRKECLMKSFLKYYARGPKGTDHYLQSQLNAFKLTTKFEPSIRSYSFRANYYQLFDICFQCRTIESLKVQLGNRFFARDQKQLITIIKNIPFHSFLSLSRLEQNRFPHLRVRCEDSFLKQKEVKEVMEKHLSLLPVVKEYRRIQQSTGLALSLSEVERVINQKKELIEENLSDSKQFKQHLLAGAKPKDEIQNIDQSIIDKYSQQQEQVIEIDIRNNYGRIYTSVNSQPMYKHGWKQRIGWAPIRQSLAAAILINTGIIQKAKTRKILKLWDPFCGSGTLLLEALSMFMNKPIRENIDEFFHFRLWPNFKEQYLDEYKRSKEQEYKNLGHDFKIIGSDISINAVNNSIANYRSLNIKNPVIPSNQPLIHKNPADNVFTIEENKVYFIAEDFEKVGEQMLKDTGFTLLTNLPYGIRSKQVIQKNQLKSIYNRFSQFLKKNYTRFQNVYVIVPMEKHFTKQHFLTISDLDWQLKEVYESGGIQVGLYGLTTNTEIVPAQIRRPTLPAQKRDKQTSLIDVKKSKQTELVNIHNIPKYILPKQPRKPKERVRWRREVHEMKLQYQRHLRNVDYQKVMKQFVREKLVNKLKKRGQDWKKKNLAQLQNKLDVYEDDIRELFEKKIQTAIEKQEKQKQQKEKRHKKNKKIVTIKRKW